MSNDDVEEHIEAAARALEKALGSSTRSFDRAIGAQNDLARLAKRSMGAGDLTKSAWVRTTMRRPPALRGLGALTNAQATAEVTGSADAFDAAGAAFAVALRDLCGDELPADLDIEHAARTAAATTLWERSIGEVVSPERFAALIGVSRQRVQRLCTDGKIVALRDRQGRWKIPAWQAPLPREARERLAELVAVFEHAGVSPWSAVSWLTEDHPELDGRAPRDLVGQPDLVRTVAERDAARAAQ